MNDATVTAVNTERMIDIFEISINMTENENSSLNWEEVIIQDH